MSRRREGRKEGGRKEKFNTPPGNPGSATEMRHVSVVAVVHQCTV